MLHHPQLVIVFGYTVYPCTPRVISASSQMVAYWDKLALQYQLDHPTHGWKTINSATIRENTWNILNGSSISNQPKITYKKWNKHKSEPRYGHHIAPLVEPPPALDWLPQCLPRVGPVPPALLVAPAAAEADVGELRMWRAAARRNPDLAPNPGAMTRQQDGKIFWWKMFWKINVPSLQDGLAETLDSRPIYRGTTYLPLSITISRQHCQHING